MAKSLSPRCVSDAPVRRRRRHAVVLKRNAKEASPAIQVRRKNVELHLWLGGVESALRQIGDIAFELREVHLLIVSYLFDEVIVAEMPMMKHESLVIPPARTSAPERTKPPSPKWLPPSGQGASSNSQGRSNIMLDKPLSPLKFLCG